MGGWAVSHPIPGTFLNHHRTVLCCGSRTGGSILPTFDVCFGIAGERDIDINLVAAVFPPATIIAVVIYLMRDLKGDLRHTESLLIGRMDRLRDDYSREMSELKGMLIERMDRLRDDHESLAREMSELKGMLTRD